ncbi:MAG: hydroxyacid dehydrogenase [Limnohabitans sp.]|jgi:(S)-sulfolactate dehydrogenase|nr:hydroxyacid dehydrogenase [Limnohabitans sp.]
MAHILISEFMDAPAVALLQQRHTVQYEPGWVDQPDVLRQAAGQADAFIVRNRTQVRGDLLAALTRCRVVGRLGVGLDNIDVPACEARGMQVIPATGANALSVAEYVIGTAMALLRGAYHDQAAMVQGAWPRQAHSNGREIHGKTLGLVGYGGIGQLTAQLGRGLGMRIMAYDPALDAHHPAFASGLAERASLETVLAQADVLSLHVPLLPSTRHLIDAARLATLKRGAILINTARGGVVDEPAVVAALRAGHLGGAALDVFEKEPLPAQADWADVPGLILTPHIAGVTAESNERVSQMIAEKVLEALAS